MRENKIDLNEKNEKRSDKKKNRKPKNQEMLYVAYIFVGIFVCMIGYFVYFQTMVSSNVITSPYNKRQDTFADRVIRGDIRSADGEVLAYTNVSEDGTETRVYPQDDLFAHAVGYASHGKSGIELLANYQLLSSHAYFLERFVNEVQEKKNYGDTVITTLNYQLQKTAYDALGDYRGTVIALEPSTGKILAMVSKPDYNLNRINTSWKEISGSSDSVLLKRYKETRRSHPLAKDGRIDEGIRKERQAMAFLKEHADIILDTSTLLTRELRSEMEKIFVNRVEYRNIYITVLSFGFKYGIPADSDLVFDVRFLPNPFYVDELKHKTGLDQEVQDFVMKYEEAHTFLHKLEDMVEFLLPNYVSEGKNQLVISIGCTGGKHRSVTLAEHLHRYLSRHTEYGLKIFHRDIEIKDIQ